MAEIDAIIDGLATNLATVSKLRVQREILDTVPIPCAIVGPPTTVEYDEVMARGADLYTFTVRVLVARASERTAQKSLFAYASGTGDRSIKAAIESDRTLGGAADSVAVRSASGVGIYGYGEADYLGIEFSVEVIA
jgi:hypothetical protein